MLNSSGGFSTPTAARSSSSSDRTPSFSPPPPTSLFQRPSHSGIFLVGDEELSSTSSRSASYGIDRPSSLSEDPSSPSFQLDPFSPPVNAPQRLLSNSSSSSSLQQQSTAILRAAPLYISVYSSTPPIPLTEGTDSSSVFPTSDDESFFTRRSPSLQPPSILRKIEQSNNTIKHIITTSMQHPPNANSQQQLPSSVIYKYHRFPATSSEEQEKL